MSVVHHREQGCPRFQRPAIAAIVLGLCITLLGHDALMAGGAHAATRAGGEPRTHREHDRAGHGHGGPHGGAHRSADPGDAPAQQPCASVRQAAARSKPDIQPDDLETARGAVELPIVSSPPAAPNPPRSLPAATRRALLQVFLN